MRVLLKPVAKFLGKFAVSLLTIKGESWQMGLHVKCLERRNVQYVKLQSSEGAVLKYFTSLPETLILSSAEFP